MWNRAGLTIWRSRLAGVGSETCFFQLDFSHFISFLMYVCLFQESWKHQPKSAALKSVKGNRGESTLGLLRKRRGLARLARVEAKAGGLSGGGGAQRLGADPTGPFLSAQGLFPRRASLLPSVSLLF